MKIFRLLLACFILGAIVSKSDIAMGASLERRLADAVCCAHYRYANEVLLFEQNKREDEATPLAYYYAAFAYMELNRSEQAEPLLKHLQQVAYSGPERWASVYKLLLRIQHIKEFSPPLFPSQPVTEPKRRVTVYAESLSAWSRPVLKALPDFIQIGQRIYGAYLPPVKFYLFPHRRPVLIGYFTL